MAPCVFLSRGPSPNKTLAGILVPLINNEHTLPISPAGILLTVMTNLLVPVLTFGLANGECNDPS